MHGGPTREWSGRHAESCRRAALLLTWLRPLESDADWVLLAFYGPMFLVWGVVSFRAARETGRVSAGVVAGIVVGFGPFLVFILLNFLRVNLFFIN